MVTQHRPPFRPHDIEGGVVQVGSGEIVAPANHVVINENTEGLWQFDNNTNDSSGNNRHFVRSRGASDEFVGSGLVPNVQCLRLDGAKEYRVVDSAFDIKGDITVATLCRIQRTGGLIAAYRGTDETAGEIHNPQWSIDTWANARKLRWLQKYGADISQTYEVSGQDFPLHELVFLAARRSGQQVQFFLDRAKFGGLSPVLTAPTGGSSAWLQIGSWDGGGADQEGEMQSLLIQSEALSDDDIFSLAGRFKPWLA